MLRRRARHRHAARAPLTVEDPRIPWIRRVQGSGPIDLDALDDLQAALLESLVDDGDVDPEDARFDAVADILGAMVLIDPGEASVAWARGQLLADLGRHGEAVHDLLAVARLCREQAVESLGEAAEDARLWADAAHARAAMSLARGGNPMAAAIAARVIEDVERRDDVDEVLERWRPEGDLRVPIVQTVLAGDAPDLEAMEHVQVWAARQALDGNEAANGAVLDALAALALVQPDEPAHPWNRGALLFELERHGEAAGDKLEAVRRMVIDSDLGPDLDRARLHATLGLLLAAQPLSAAVVAARLTDPASQAEASRLIEEWIAA